MLAFAARRADFITAIHLVAAPFAFVIWLTGAPIFFAFIPDSYPDAVLVPIAIGYILLIIPVFIVVVRVLRRLSPIEPRPTSVLYVGPNGYGVGKITTTRARLQPWSRWSRVRCRGMSPERVRIRIYHLIWPAHLRFDIRLNREQAGVLESLCAQWIAAVRRKKKRTADA